MKNNYLYAIFFVKWWIRQKIQRELYVMIGFAKPEKAWSAMQSM